MKRCLQQSIPHLQTYEFMKVAILPVTPFEQNCSLWLCEETGKIAIIDPGGNLDAIKSTAEKMGGTPEVIFVTHGHLDHCAQARELANDLGVKIIGPHKDDDFWLAQLPQQSPMLVPESKHSRPTSGSLEP